MGERLAQVILQFAPEYWEKRSHDMVELTPRSKEYSDISEEISEAISDMKVPVIKIKRNQNIHDLGQFLVREQHLLHLNPTTNFYRVRRFVKIGSQHLDTALKHNLDYRRCGMNSLSFQKEICVKRGDLILVVQVVTSDITAAYITPERSSDYFIDYIVYF